MNPAFPDDSTLVQQCLAGNREAFGAIVSRYQSLICSVAYSATGSFSKSEDLAQETFITAWQELPRLGNPAKLRFWLCGIVRNLIGKTLRKDGNEPVAQAISLEKVDDPASFEQQPIQRIISEEEENILWRAMEKIPPLYREPLILFYREHQSIEAVATALDLTEETARQRLSRGRKVLQNQILDFVEHTLANSGPDKAFTVGVLAALPLGTTLKTASAWTAGTVAAKSVSSKSILAVCTSGAILGALSFVSLLAFSLFLGACLGCLMALSVRQSEKMTKSVIHFWSTVTFVFLLFGFIPGLCESFFPISAPFQSWVNKWEASIYLVIFAIVVIWIWRWKRLLPVVEPKLTEPTEETRKRFKQWLLLGLITPVVLTLLFLFLLPSLNIPNSEKRNTAGGIEIRPAIFFVLGAGATLLLMNSRKPWKYRGKAIPPNMDHTNKMGINLLRTMAVAVAMAFFVGVSGIGLVTQWHSVSLPASELSKSVDAHQLGRFEIFEFANGTRKLYITPLFGSPYPSPIILPADDHTEQLLEQKHIPYNVHVQNRDFGFAVPRPLISAFFMATGLAVALFILRWSAKGTLFETRLFLSTFGGISFLWICFVLFGHYTEAKLFPSVTRIAVSRSNHGNSLQSAENVIHSKASADSVIDTLHLNHLLTPSGIVVTNKDYIENVLALYTIVKIHTNEVRYLIDIQHASRNAQLAADIANGMAKYYCQQQNSSLPGTAQVEIAAAPNPFGTREYPPLFILPRLLIGIGVGLLAGIAITKTVHCRKSCPSTPAS